MSYCECERNNEDCPVCEIYGIIYDRFVKTGPLDLHDELHAIIRKAEKAYHQEIVTRYDGGIGET